MVPPSTMASERPPFPAKATLEASSRSRVFWSLCLSSWWLFLPPFLSFPSSQPVVARVSSPPEESPLAVPPSALSSSVVLLVTVPASMETVAGVIACGSYPIGPSAIVFACAICQTRRAITGGGYAMSTSSSTGRFTSSLERDLVGVPLAADAKPGYKPRVSARTTPPAPLSNGLPNPASCSPESTTRGAPAVGPAGGMPVSGPRSRGRGSGWRSVSERRPGAPRPAAPATHRPSPLECGAV